MKVLNQFFRNNNDFAGGRGNAREIQRSNPDPKRIFKNAAVFVYPATFEVDEDAAADDGAQLVQRKIIKNKSNSKNKSKKTKTTKVENLY